MYMHANTFSVGMNISTFSVCMYVYEVYGTVSIRARLTYVRIWGKNN